MHTQFSSENLKGRDHLENLSTHRKKTNIKMDLSEIGWEGM
jgi:hypothetical protein